MCINFSYSSNQYVDFFSIFQYNHYLDLEKQQLVGKKTEDIMREKLFECKR